MTGKDLTGWKQLDMTGNGWNGWKWLDMTRYGWMGWKQLEIAGNGLKQLEMAAVLSCKSFKQKICHISKWVSPWLRGGGANWSTAPMFP